jgi:hypothetical protein
VQDTINAAISEKEDDNDDRDQIMASSTIIVEISRSALETEFQSLVKKWRRETAVFSSITRKVLHPAYQRIIGMGPAVLPLILQELERKPAHWFWALNAISGEDPVRPEDDFDAAVSDWLQWGRDKGHIQ